MLFKTLARAGGKTVQKDISATNRILEKQHFAQFKHKFDTYHEKKISDLASDEGVSASWIKELIHDSGSIQQLNKIVGYMGSKAKTANLTPGAKREIMGEVARKMEAVKDKELLLKMAAFIRDHGGDMF
ncbi:hypothetical protein KP806_07475 [Paenibacillus sp. N4]|uniref:hypothetical protein n=1 Tax=Paenibacillus vietnamensis TaxID=2590547 RepID=UPI001CD092F2|nr:hypothetical protein [Paenibacillus vietnamensis]MCA0754886.1 hypothetical protein [Paenibacillus vietnamensis]